MGHLAGWCGVRFLCPLGGRFGGDFSGGRYRRLLGAACCGRRRYWSPAPTRVGGHGWEGGGSCGAARSGRSGSDVAWLRLGGLLCAASMAAPWWGCDLRMSAMLRIKGPGRGVRGVEELSPIWRGVWCIGSDGSGEAEQRGSAGARPRFSGFCREGHGRWVSARSGIAWTPLRVCGSEAHGDEEVCSGGV